MENDFYQQDTPRALGYIICCAIFAFCMIFTFWEEGQEGRGLIHCPPSPGLRLGWWKDQQCLKSARENRRGRAGKVKVQEAYLRFFVFLSLLEPHGPVVSKSPVSGLGPLTCSSPKLKEQSSYIPQCHQCALPFIQGHWWKVTKLSSSSQATRRGQEITF